MKTRYVYLSLKERDILAIMLSEERSLGDIAKSLGRNKGTILRELKRNCSPEYKLYLSHRAHGRAEGRIKEASKRPRLKNDRIVSYVTARLKEGWSPELISGRIGIDHLGLSISHEAIYRYIYHPDTWERQELIQRLIRAQRKQKGIGIKERKTKIPNRVPLT